MDLGCFWGITGNFRLCSLVKPVKLLLRPLLKQLNPPQAESGFFKACKLLWRTLFHWVAGNGQFGHPHYHGLWRALFHWVA